MIAADVTADPWHPATPILTTDLLSGRDGPHADYADRWVHTALTTRRAR